MGLNRGGGKIRRHAAGAGTKRHADLVQRVGVRMDFVAVVAPQVVDRVEQLLSTGRPGQPS